MARTLQKKNIRNVPPDIKGAVVEYAQVQDKTISDAVSGILTGYFNGTLTGYIPIHGPALGDQIHFYMTPALATRVWRESRKTGETESSCMLGILARFFGISFEPVYRGKRATAA